MPVAIDRALGNYQMSIGTSLALEGLCHTGDYSDRRGSPPIKTTDALWINLRTLVRNAVTAFPSKDQPDLSTDDVVECVLDDWDEIVDTLNDQDSTIEIKLYDCHYTSFIDTVTDAGAKVNTPTTAKQIDYDNLESTAILKLLKDHSDLITVFDTELKGDGDVHSKRCVLLTHCPIDLMSNHGFLTLGLLESRTGAYKSKVSWNSKLNIHKDVRPIYPFNIITLLMLGEKVLIKPQSIGMKRAFHAVAIDKNWSSITSLVKMYTDIKLSGNKELYEQCKKFHACKTFR